MISIKCAYCDKISFRRQRRNSKSGNNYCSASCQMNYEYDNDIRDKFETVKKAQELSQERMKIDNWLNYPEARNKLKNIQQTEEYKLKCSIPKRGELNPMYGKKANNYRSGHKNYSRYMIPKHIWKVTKEEVRQRANYKCENCDCEENLQIHHRIPYFITYDNSINNLICLCVRCHMKAEPRVLSIKSIKKIEKEEIVYNFAVEEDESYTAEDIIVHNCRCVIEARTKE